MKESSIKVGVITDQTGPLSFMGVANANVATMVIDDINAKGGLLGQTVELYLEDSETTDSAAAAAATKLVEHDDVDVVVFDELGRGGGGSAVGGLAVLEVELDGLAEQAALRVDVVDDHGGDVGVRDTHE